MRKLFILLLISPYFSFAQIIVTNTQTPEELVEQVLVGSGVVVSNVTFNTSTVLAQNTQTQCGYFNATGTTFPITQGIILGTGNTSYAIGPDIYPPIIGEDNSGTHLSYDDPDLILLNPTAIFHHNQAILEFDFVPAGDSVLFNYIFGSEEYHFFSTSNFNDAFGFFISGPGFTGSFSNGAVNIALVPGTNLPVTMNNLNNGPINMGPCVNCEYLLDNQSGPDVAYNAYTKTLTAGAKVTCGETYHIKLAIEDIGDDALDSGIFLEAKSFSSSGITVEIASSLGTNTMSEGCDSALVRIIRSENTSVLNQNYTVSGTATNGTDYTLLNGTAVFPIGVDTVSFWAVPFVDALVEGNETLIISVEYTNSCGELLKSEGAIEISDNAPLRVSVSDTLIKCPVPFIELKATIEGGSPDFTFNWNTGGEEDTEAVPGNIVGTTTYTVNVTDACGEETSTDVEVTVDPATIPTINFNETSFTICKNGIASINSNVSNPYSNNIDYLWEPIGVSTKNIVANPTATTLYYLTINDGCYSVKDSVNVVVNSIEIDSLSLTNVVNCPSTGTSSLGSIIVSPENEPGWTYQIIDYTGVEDNSSFLGLNGNLNYVLSIISEDGCKLDTTAFIKIETDTTCVDTTISNPPLTEPEFKFEPLNIFTPNGDGINDQFSFSYNSTGISEFRCSIINRWGIIVYEMNNIADKWSGANLSGETASDGVYFYTYHGKTIGQEDFSGHGTVTLMR